MARIRPALISTALCVSFGVTASADPRLPVNIEFSAVSRSVALNGQPLQVRIYAADKLSRVDLPQSALSIYFDRRTDQMLVARHAMRRIEEVPTKGLDALDISSCDGGELLKRGGNIIAYLQLIAIAANYRYANTFHTPTVSSTATVRFVAVEQYEGRATKKYDVIGPLTFLNVLPGLQNVFTGQMWTTRENIVVRFSGRTALRGKQGREQIIPMAMELKDLKIGPIERVMFVPPRDYERIRVEVDLTACR